MRNLYKIENELYIVDNTEEINKDTKPCWCIDTSNNKLVLHQGVLPDYHYKYYKKIIMSTNTSINVLCGCGKDCGAKESGVQAIDDEFLEWFVKNPSCESVDVQKWASLAECGYSYHIIIPQEPKQTVEQYEQQGLEKYAYEFQQETPEEAGKRVSELVDAMDSNMEMFSITNQIDELGYAVSNMRDIIHEIVKILDVK
jgi:hypothetical protein